MRALVGLFVVSGCGSPRAADVPAAPAAVTATARASAPPDAQTDAPGDADAAATADSLRPSEPVHRPGRWKQLAINSTTRCALRVDGTLWCWGRVPVFGNGFVEEPRQVEGIANATAVAVGYTSTCVLADGRAWCLGWNYNGSVGVPPTDSHDLRRTPERVPIREPLVSLAAGTGHACALGVSGATWCWGGNGDGAVGVAPAPHEPGQSRELRGPTRVPIPPARTITAGRGISCAIARDAPTVWCWGDLDIHGPLGASERSHSPPTAMGSVNGARIVLASETEACVIQADATLACWGLMPHIPGQRLEIRARRDARMLQVHPELADARAIALGGPGGCAISRTGTRCFGWYVDLDSPVLAADVPGDYVQLAIGGDEACGLTTDGELWCWKFPTKPLPGAFKLGRGSSP